MKLSLKGVATFFLIVLIVAGTGVVYTLFTGYSHEEIGRTDFGYVSKDCYNFYGSDKTIVLITGIHPREKLAINPEVDAARLFALFNHVNVVNYNVTVTRDADDFSRGRANGERLVADYVVGDISSTNASAVVISHSHNPGYGEGFYVATPMMDEASVGLAEGIRDGGIDFNYYPVSDDMEYRSSSAVLVSKPIAGAGYPTLVYEIPEDISEADSTGRTYELFEKIKLLVWS